jgi:hypothetical protein
MIGDDNKVITVYLCEIDGEDLISLAGMSLLYGVPPRELRGVPAGELDEQVRTGTLPHDWVKQGRRRASEAKAATGSEDAFDVMAYWAAKDYGARVEFVWKDKTHG